MVELMKSTAQSWNSVTELVKASVGHGKRLGVQLFITLEGEPVVDIAEGELSPGVSLDRLQPLPWLCNSKILTVLILAKLQEQGLIHTSNRLGDILPHLSGDVVDRVSLHDLLTHTVIYDQETSVDWSSARPNVMRQVQKLRLTVPPGQRASYNNSTSWFLLAEAIASVSGESYSVHVDRLLVDLGMKHTFRYNQGDSPTSFLYSVSPAGVLTKDEVFPSDEFWPGTEIWGPAYEMALPLEALAAAPFRGMESMPREDSVGHFLSTQRTHLKDEYFAGLPLRWSRGLCTDPAWFGAPKGSSVFGHTGFFTSLVLKDPDRDFGVSFASNTFDPQEPMLRRLDNRVVRAAYEVIGSRR